jgi:hypothetical protein
MPINLGRTLVCAVLAALAAGAQAQDAQDIPTMCEVLSKAELLAQIDQSYPHLDRNRSLQLRLPGATQLVTVACDRLGGLVSGSAGSECISVVEQKSGALSSGLATGAQVLTPEGAYGIHLVDRYVQIPMFDGLVDACTGVRTLARAKTAAIKGYQPIEITSMPGMICFNDPQQNPRALRVSVDAAPVAGGATRRVTLTNNGYGCFGLPAVATQVLRLQTAYVSQRDGSERRMPRLSATLVAERTITSSGFSSMLGLSPPLDLPANSPEVSTASSLNDVGTLAKGYD